MIIKSVPSGRGVDWISQGVGLFLKNPLIWIVNLVIFLAIVTALTLIPLLGAFAAMLLQPVLVGGLMLGCEALNKGEELRIEHLFDGFSRNRDSLILVGLCSGIAYLLIGGVVFVLVGGSLGLGLVGEITEQADVALSGAMLGLLLSALVALALSIPIAMATWFAPALVVFRNTSPLEALKASFFGCLRNVRPFMLYGIVALAC